MLLQIDDPYTELDPVQAALAHEIERQLYRAEFRIVGDMLAFMVLDGVTPGRLPPPLRPNRQIMREWIRTQDKVIRWKEYGQGTYCNTLRRVLTVLRADGRIAAARDRLKMPLW